MRSGSASLFQLFLVMLPLLCALFWVEWQCRILRREQPVPATTTAGSEFYATRQAIGALLVRVVWYMALLFVCGWLLATALWWHQAVSEQRQLGGYLVLSLISGTLAIGWLVSRLHYSIRTFRIRLLEIESEHVVDLELQPLRNEGYELLRQVAAAEYRLANVVVGRNGVFVIAAIARLKPARVNRSRHRILVDGSGIHVPGEFGMDNDLAVYADLKEQCEALGDSLSNRLEQPIHVVPVFVYPGWYVRSTDTADARVMNEKLLRFRIPKLPGQRLSDSTISAVAGLLDSRASDADLLSAAELGNSRAA